MCRILNVVSAIGGVQRSNLALLLVRNDCGAHELYVVAEINGVIVSASEYMQVPKGASAMLQLQLPKINGQLTLKLYADGVQADERTLLYAYTPPFEEVFPLAFQQMMLMIAVVNMAMSVLR